MSNYSVKHAIQPRGNMLQAVPYTCLHGLTLRLLPISRDTGGYPCWAKETAEMHWRACAYSGLIPSPSSIYEQGLSKT